MSTISSIFTLFTVLSGVLIFGIWSNIQAYAQQSSSSPTPLSPPTVSRSTTISQHVKAIMCAPGSPSLKVVNTTEARICGIPKTVKSNTTTAAAIPPTSTTGISSPTTTKLSTANVAAPKQQKISTTAATSQLSKQTTGASKESTAAAPSIAPIRNVSNKPSSSSSPSTIAPQVNAVNNKHQQQEQLQPTASNVVAGRNSTFATTSPAVTPDTLKYLGYQGSATAGDGSSSGSKDKHSSDTKSSSSGHNDDDNGKSSSSSIINDISSVIKKSFNYKHSRHSDSSDEVSYFSDNSFDDNFPFTASASSSAIAGGASASASASAGSG
jgi:signaling mucin MSB2